MEGRGNQSGASGLGFEERALRSEVSGFSWNTFFPASGSFAPAALGC